MKFIKFLLIIFISINSPIKADSNQNTINELKRGGNLIFIRHAYAPGGGDPKNFEINDCKTQRNLSNNGREQAKKIGSYFKDNNIPIGKVYSSEWCRCKETASIAFSDFETKSFLNSFFSSRFIRNKDSQIKKFKTFINNWNKDKNLVFVTHYVVIKEILNINSSSGEVIITDSNHKIINRIQVKF